MSKNINSTNNINNINNILEFKDISVEYDKTNEVLHNFNLTVNQGEIVALVGESGSGKTTAIRTAIGLLPQNGEVSNGDILFNGKSMKNLSKQEWQTLRGNELSMIFQDCGSMLNPIRTIGSQFVEHIRTHSKMDKKSAYKKATEMLEKMGLYDGDAIMKTIPSKLSGGMRQRVGIAMAMTFNPSVLIADEPTAALDVTIQSQIVRQMMELRDNYNTSIIIVTHNLGVATYMADKIVVLLKGEIVEVGDREQILNNPQSEYTKKLLNSVPNLKGGSYV